MDSRLSKLRGLGCEVCEKGEMVVVSRKDYNLELTLCVPIEVHREEMVFNDSIQTLSAGLKILENPKYLRSILREENEMGKAELISKVGDLFVKKSFELKYAWKIDSLYGNVVLDLYGERYIAGKVEDYVLHLMYVSRIENYWGSIQNYPKKRLIIDNAYNSLKSDMKIRKDLFELYYFIIRNFDNCTNEYTAIISYDSNNGCIDDNLTSILRMFTNNVHIIEHYQKKPQAPKIDKTIGYNDIFGLDNIIEEMKVFGDLLKKNKSNESVYKIIPKKIIFVGEAGCGKTMLANAFANENNLSLEEVSYEDLEFAHSRVFRNNSKNSIIFIDEIDKFFSNSKSNPNFQKIQHQLLIALSNSENHNIVIACANSFDEIPAPLLRSGRFDIKIYFPILSTEAKGQMIKGYLKKNNIANTLILDDIVNYLGHVSGSDIESIVNYATVMMKYKELKSIDNRLMIEAIEMIMSGVFEKEKLLKDDILRVAVHEAGHTVVSMLLNGIESISSVSIIQSVYSMGRLITNEKKELLTKRDLEKMIKIGLAGYIAETAFFSDSSLGYTSDFLKVNNVVNDMLTRLDILNFQGMSNLNRDNMSEFNNSKTYKKLIKKCLKVTHKMIKKNKNIIKKVADKLVENKVLYRKDLEEIMCGSKTEPQKLETISVNAFNNRV